MNVKKLQGTRMNVSTVRGTLKIKAIYAESSQVSCSSGRIQLGHIHGEEQHHLIQTIDPSFTSPPTRMPKWGSPLIENSSWGTNLHLMLEGLLFWCFPQVPNGILGELKLTLRFEHKKQQQHKCVMLSEILFCLELSLPQLIDGSHYLPGVNVAVCNTSASKICNHIFYTFFLKR